MNPSKANGRTPRREKTTLSSSSGSRDKLRDPVRVFCRIRPLKEDRESTCVKLLSPTVLVLSTPSESKMFRSDAHYTFKHIFTSYADQKEIFEHVAYPVVEDLLRGKNGLLFTYGVTGSGKTYTLTGDYNNPGIMPRSIYAIFNSMEEFQSPKYVIKPDKMNGFEVQSEKDALRDRKSEERLNIRSAKKQLGEGKQLYVNDGTKIVGLNENSLYAVFVSYVEIYNNTVYDLLDSSSGKELQAKILREDSQKNMYVNGVVEVEVKSAAEAFDLFNFGQKRKRMGHTVLNSESSRSHSIFTVRVVQLEQNSCNTEGERVIPEQNLLKVGQLCFVDLAGSERTSRTQNTGKRLREASSINNSLMTLRTCLEALRENQLQGSTRLVPYRESRLTLLFKNYFESESLVQMIVCINPSVQDFEENLQVVKFAELTQDVHIPRAETRYTPYSKKKPVAQINTPSKATSITMFKLSPNIPHIKFDLGNPELCISELTKLANTLRMRKQKGEVINREVARKERDFRKLLLDVDQTQLENRAKINSLQTLLKKEKHRSGNLETRICVLEEENGNMVMKQDELKDVIKGLQHTIDEKNMRLNQNILEREKSKQKLVEQSEKMTQELDAKLRRQREHLQAAMIAKENKLQKVREILDDPNVNIASQKFSTPIESEVQVVEEYDPVHTPLRESRRENGTPHARQRRSRSLGEVWLEHNSVKPVPLGTVLQPSMKKRKSVTKLSKAKDVTNPKQNKYCLIAQDADVDGEIETKLYKGDILPTCGGGAQVVFNDVECLRQESP